MQAVTTGPKRIINESLTALQGKGKKGVDLRNWGKQCFAGTREGSRQKELYTLKHYTLVGKSVAYGAVR